MIILFVLVFSEFRRYQEVCAQNFPEHVYDYSDYGDYELETSIFGMKTFSTAPRLSLPKKKIPENPITFLDLTKSK